MGSWRRVQIVGSCAAIDVASLRDEVEWDPDGGGVNGSEFGPLSSSGAPFSLPLWPARTISVVGNLFERGYDADAVARHLERLAAYAPSLACRVHVGVDGEGDGCECTVVLEAGVARVAPPEVASIPPIPVWQSRDAIMSQLSRGRF